MLELLLGSHAEREAWENEARMLVEPVAAMLMTALSNGGPGVTGTGGEPLGIG